MNTQTDLEKERGKFRKETRKWVKKYGITPISELYKGKGEVNVIITTRVKDFDADNNLLWENTKNKSYPSGQNCSLCGNEVVLSKGMMEMIVMAKVSEKKDIQIVFACTRCFRRKDFDKLLEEKTKT